MKELHDNWFIINNTDEIDTPALVVYEERIKENIHQLTTMVHDISMLRPHVKTNKMAEVCTLMMEKGIRQFKCATIAEAEMLAQIQAADVLLAYQPIGPKAERLAALIKAYPGTHFSCLADNKNVAASLSDTALRHRITIDIFIDLNTGMNRTGILPDASALALYEQCLSLPGIHPAGLHAYDGHIRDTDVQARQQKSDEGFRKVQALQYSIHGQYGHQPKIVVGGSPTFPTHVHRHDVECSPGTFVFWDWGYKHQLPDEPFIYAALVITRVVSIVDEHTICTDLGHKSVAAENPLPRVHFLNDPGAAPVGQSEEHLVLKVDDAWSYAIGDVLYGVPVHICPTVALYEKAVVINDHIAAKEWKVIARNRKINY